MQQVRIRGSAGAACLRTSGSDGVGAFNDGKPTLSPSYDGRLGHLVGAGLGGLIAHVDCVFVELGAHQKLHGSDPVAEAAPIQPATAAGDAMRTFYVCLHGKVALEPYQNVVTVNGHSNAGWRSANTNFAVLVTTGFTQPFGEPTAYGRHVARLANMLGGTAIVQRLGDLLEGRRSTPEHIAGGAVRPTLAQATPDDLAFILPYRSLTDIRQMLQAIDALAPGLWAPDTLRYGVKAEFYSAELGLSPQLETQIPGLYAAGDGAGVSRGLIQAAASGVVAGRAITARTRERERATSLRAEPRGPGGEVLGQ